MAITEYKVLVHATGAGMREVLVFPPLDERLAGVLRQSLQNCANQTNDRPKGYVNTPKQIEHESYGLGTRFLLLNCIQISSLKWLGQHAVDVLSQATGNWPDINFQLDLPEETKRDQPLTEDVVVKDGYL